jgi:hypothetical protein
MQKKRGSRLTLQEHTTNAVSAPGFGLPAEVTTKKHFAELIGVTPGRVSQLIKDGLPVEPSGGIDVERGKAWVRDNVDANRRRLLPEQTAVPLSPQDPPVPSPQPSARMEKTAVETEMLRVNLAERRGELINRAEVQRAIESCIRADSDAWIGWVNRVAPELARETGGDLATIAALLDRNVREQLQTLNTISTENLGL